MSRVLAAITAAATVMDGASLAFASIGAQLKTAQDELKAAGAESPALNAAVETLERESAELSAAIAANTSAAATEPSTADAATPVTDPPPFVEPAGGDATS